MTKELINVTRSIYHELLVLEMVRNIRTERCIVDLCNFESDTLFFQGTGESLSMDTLIRNDDDEPEDQLKVKQQNKTGPLVDQIYMNFTKGIIANKQISTNSDAAAIYKVDKIYTNSDAPVIMTNKQIRMISDTAEFRRVDEITTNSVAPGFFIEDIIVKQRISKISVAAAMCSNLPFVVTGYESTATDDHWNAFSSETTTAEFRKDSSVIGVSNTFGDDFQTVTVCSLSPRIVFEKRKLDSLLYMVWWGGKSHIA